MTDDAPYSPLDAYRQLLKPDTTAALGNWVGACNVAGYQSFPARAQCWTFLMVAADDEGFRQLSRSHAARFSQVLEAGDALTVGALLAAREVAQAWGVDFTPHAMPHEGGTA